MSEPLGDLYDPGFAVEVWVVEPESFCGCVADVDGKVAVKVQLI